MGEEGAGREGEKRRGEKEGAGREVEKRRGKKEGTGREGVKRRKEKEGTGREGCMGRREVGEGEAPGLKILKAARSCSDERAAAIESTALSTCREGWGGVSVGA